MTMWTREEYSKTARCVMGTQLITCFQCLRQNNACTSQSKASWYSWIYKKFVLNDQIKLRELQISHQPSLSKLTPFKITLLTLSPLSTKITHQQQIYKSNDTTWMYCLGNTFTYRYILNTYITGRHSLENYLHTSKKNVTNKAHQKFI